MMPPKITMISEDNAWRKTAKSRLRFELAGLAFACRQGFGPEEYARHLWDKGAVGWMGKTRPSATEYLLKEAEAFRRFYPEVAFAITEAEKDRAELVFTKGCLAGWGEDPWRLALSLGLAKEEVCSYCQASFRLWAEQFGLMANIGPDEAGACRLRIVRP